MKVIKYVLVIVLLTLGISYSCQELERPVFSNDLGRSVRFNLLTYSGELVPEGIIRQNAERVFTYEHTRALSLAIPVCMTSEPLSEEVLVYFSCDSSGSSDVRIYPEDRILHFSGTDLNDTIFLEFTRRWDALEINQLVFSLDSTSNDSIQIGYIDPVEEIKDLTIELGELNLKYSFPVENSVEINGDLGEEVLISVLFPNGFFPEEIDSLELLLPQNADFEYVLESLPFKAGDTKIVFRLFLKESLDDETLTYIADFVLATLEDYHLSGNDAYTVMKPEFIPRDIELNTAAHFYNLSDQFYRTYGETWMDYNADDTCAWTAFNAFTFPVEVSSSHPFAVLGDDKGTLDPADDIYYHAFRIGFNSPNAGRTTNSFNLKRWFDNEYSDADMSPGFNILQALEFYPDENGTSANGGIVKVVPQDIRISTKIATDVFNTFVISIEGEGEYYLISDGVYKIELEFRATNEELFGGTRAVKMLMYNTDQYEDPMDIVAECFKPIDLRNL